jgi:hypothetical protein
MKILLRSTIVCNANDERDRALLYNNFKELKESGLTSEVGEDAPIWKFIQDFVNKYTDVPEATTLKSHFTSLGDSQVVGRLDVLLLQPCVTGGDFTIRLIDTEANRRKGALIGLAKEAAEALTTKGPEAFWSALDKARELDTQRKSPKQRKIYAGVDERYAYIEQRSQVYDRELGAFLPIKSFALRGQAESYWISPHKVGARTTYLNTTFNPTSAPTPKHLLNTYDPSFLYVPSAGMPDLTPLVEKYMGLFQSLLNCLARDPIDHDYLEDWLRYVVTHPANKCCALILRGVPGSGKGTLSIILEALFGRYACRLDNERIEGKFNGFMETCLLAVGDEVGSDFFRDKKAGGNKFKGLITEGKIQLECKGLESKEVPNYTKWLFTANQAIPLVLEADDRRYSVINTLDELDPAVGSAIADAVHDPDFLQAVVDYLVHYAGRVVSTFKPLVSLKNAAREAIIEGSIDSAGRWWRYELPPTGRYPSGALYLAYTKWLEDQGERPVAAIRFSTARPNAVHKGNGRKSSVKKSLQGFFTGDVCQVYDIINPEPTGTYETWTTGGYTPNKLSVVGCHPIAMEDADEEIINDILESDPATLNQ